MKHYKIIVRGIVQGVFFRASAKEQAERSGISGWCKNQPDGSVLIHAEGEGKSLDDFIEWCHSGPRRARVMQVEIEELPPEHRHGFDIRR